MLELFYLKLLSPIDLRSRLHSVWWWILVEKWISNKKDFKWYLKQKRYFTNTNSKRCSQLNEIKIKYSERLWSLFCVCRKIDEEFDSFLLEKDRCFVFQTLGFRLECLPLFIEPLETCFPLNKTTGFVLFWNAFALQHVAWWKSMFNFHLKNVPALQKRESHTCARCCLLVCVKTTIRKWHVWCHVMISCVCHLDKRYFASYDHLFSALPQASFAPTQLNWPKYPCAS